MTVQNTTSKVERPGDGTNNTFSFSPLVVYEPQPGDTHDFEISIVVIATGETESVLTEGSGTSNYSVSISGYPGTGDIIYPASGASRLPSTKKLVIKRVVKYKQTTNFSNNTAYFAEEQERLHDLHVMRDIDLKEKVDRAITVPIGDPRTSDHILQDIFDTETNAAASAAAAAASETAAATSETNAEAAKVAAEAAAASISLPIPIGSGGTGASTAAAARTALGLGALATKTTVAANDESDDAWSTAASASTVDLGAINSRNVNITGTTTITSFGNTGGEGRTYRVRFSGALTLTHNATSLILPGGANITTAAGDTAEFVKESGTGNWRCTDYQKADGQALVAPSASPFSAAYTSSNQTITAGGSLTLAHGLGGMPTLMSAELICTTAEFGYSVNDVVPVALNTQDASTTSSRGVAVVPDATNLNLRFGSLSNSFGVLHKDNGSAQTITNARWALRMRAWR